MPLLSFSHLQASFAESERAGDNVIGPAAPTPEMLAHAHQTAKLAALSETVEANHETPAQELDALLAAQTAQIDARDGVLSADDSRRDAVRAQEAGCKESGIADAELDALLAAQTASRATLFDRIQKSLADSSHCAEAPAETPDTPVSAQIHQLPVRRPAAPPVMAEAPARRPPDQRAAREILKQFDSKPLGDIVEYQTRQSFFSKPSSFMLIPPALLKTTTAESAAAEGMVATAIAQGWGSLQIAGEPEFKAQVFYHATKLGIEITNYTPSPEDLARLRKDRIVLPEWLAPANQIMPGETASKSQPPAAGKSLPGIGL